MVAGNGRRAAVRGGWSGECAGDRSADQYWLRRSFGGVAALLGMLNSCASNVTVVNIDNGFGAGFVASLINRNWEEGFSFRSFGLRGFFVVQPKTICTLELPDEAAVKD